MADPAGRTSSAGQSRGQPLAAGAAVIAITGAMAAGKSTVAEALAGRLPLAAHVRGDAFRRMIVSGRAEMTPPLSPAAVGQLALRHRLAASVADGYARAGITAVVQDLYLGEDLARFVAMIHHRPVYVIVLTPQAGVLEQRDRSRGRTAYHGWTAAEFDRHVRRDTPPIELWLDTSGLTVEETVHAILTDLGTARVA